jgi:eukaryotic-like serine/threonine-protein kinase
MTGESSHWARVEALFHEALEVDASQRDAFLRQRCGEEESLYQEVVDLLAADAQTHDLIGQAVHREAERIDSGGLLGRSVGPWRIVREIGHGGMGTVYLAERADDSYQARVALKVLSGVAAPEASRRMRSERRILASLNHPGIARLIDGGETAEGRPFLVMEHVDGDPLDAYCRDRELGLRERIGLLVEICEAVEYAHSRLVVHRDLKPANVLVDATGRPKLLDFGIAKLLEDDARFGGRTRTGIRPMTTRYASPEQVLGDRITTATDVYSLGVILYELLTGALPHPPEARSARAVEDAILTHEPEAPSAVARRLRTASGGGTAATPQRIDADLDTITLKALSKEPGRRYASVARLADDLRRFLDGQPVLARRTTWTYRAGKFVRRNRGATVGSLATLVSVLFFGIQSGLHLMEARGERVAAQTARDEAQAVTSFLVDVFRATDPNEARGLEVTAREILGNASARVREELADPGVQGAVMIALGRAYVRLGANDSALVLLSDAAERVEAAHGGSSDAYAEALRQLGVAHEDAGDVPAAEALYLESLGIREELLPPEHPSVLIVKNHLGNLYAGSGRPELAIAQFESILPERRRRGETAPLAVVLTNYGQSLRMVGRDSEAERVEAEADALLRDMGITP